MIVTVQTGYTATQPTHVAVTARSRVYVPGSKPGVLVFHGSSGTAREPLTLPYGTGWAGEGLIKRIADRGRPVMSADWGGPTSWANDTALTQIGQGHTWFKTGGGLGIAADAPVALVGASMGALTALNWALRNPTLVESLSLLIPVLDMQHMYTAFPTPHKVNIDAAYGGAAAGAAAANAANRNPILFAGSLPNVPVKIWYSTNDTVHPAPQAAHIQSFADAVPGPAEVRPVGPFGHVVEMMPSEEVADFVYDAGNS